MENKWKCYRLGDIATFSYGQLPKKELIGSGEYVVFSGYKYSEPYPEKNVSTGDLIVVARGVGGTGDVKLVNQDSFLTNLSIKIVLNNSIVRNEFIYYLFSINNLRYLDSGSAQSQITISDLANVEVSVPDLVTQGSIIYYLKTLDQKIKINSEINQTLEQMAQTLFKSWFVDFDPVIDNALDVGNNIPDPLQARAELRQKMRTSQDFQPLPADVRVLFPAEFEKTELGWVPKMWRINEFGKFIQFVNGKAEKTEQGGKFPLYGANGIIGYTDSFRFNNAIIIGRVGAYCGAIEYCSNEFCSSDNTIVATPKFDVLNIPFVLYLLKEFNLNRYAGGAAQPLLNQKTLNKLEFSLPPIDVINKYSKFIGDNLKKSVSLYSENKSLRVLLNTIASRLISGELRLDDLPDEFVTAANE